MPQVPASPTSLQIRNLNRSRILTEIRRVPGVSRSQLAKKIGLTEASLSRITRDLIAEGLIAEREGAARPIRGRPNVGLWLRADGVHVLCVALTAYEHKFSIVGSTGERVVEGSIPGLPGATPEAVVDHLRDQIMALRKRPDINLDRLSGVAISISGDIDAQRRIAVSASGVGWSDSPLGQLFEDALHVPVVLQSVSNALHIAEVRYGEGQAPPHSLLLHAGLGISASLMSNGMLSAGAEHESGIEHILVGRGPGDPLRLTDVSSGRAILHRLGHPSAIDGSVTADVGLHLGLPHAVRQANAGDPNAVAIFAEAGHRLVQSFLGVVALVHPEQIILAGPLTAARPFVDAIRTGLREFTRSTRIPEPAIIVGRTGYLRATELTGLDRFLFSQVADGHVAPRPVPEAMMPDPTASGAMDVRQVPASPYLEDAVGRGIGRHSG